MTHPPISQDQISLKYFQSVSDTELQYGFILEYIYLEKKGTQTKDECQLEKTKIIKKYK